MKGVHATIIPCRSVRIRGNVMVLSGVTNLVYTDGSFPFRVRNLAAYVRLSGKRVRGELRIVFTRPDGTDFLDDRQGVPAFDIAGVAETWFDTRWVAFPSAGEYNLRLELNGSVIAQTMVVVLEP